MVRKKFSCIHNIAFASLQINAMINILPSQLPPPHPHHLNRAAAPHFPRQIFASPLILLLLLVRLNLAAEPVYLEELAKDLF